MQILGLLQGLQVRYGSKHTPFIKCTFDSNTLYNDDAMEIDINMLSFFQISGLVTGFLCCSVVPPPNEPPAPPPASALPRPTIVKKAPSAVSRKSYNHHQSNVYICTPSEPHQSPLATSSEVSYGPPGRVLGPPWVSPGSQCIVSSSSSSNGGSFLIKARPQRPVCPWCQSTNPGDDCRDGFCSSVWNRSEAAHGLMRPIHI